MKHKRIDKTVFFHAAVTISNNGDKSGYIQFSLPIPALNPTTLHGRETSVGAMLQGIVSANSSAALIFNYDGSFPGGNDETLIISGNYKAAERSGG